MKPYIYKFWVLPVLLLLLTTGCFSPKMIKPTAEQNKQNILNLKANVNAMTQALRQEFELHSKIMLRQVRNSVRHKLNDYYADSPSRITATDDQFTSSTAGTRLAQNAEAIKNRINSLHEGRKEAAKVEQANSYPVAIELALGKHGITIPKILKDSIELDALEIKISGEIFPSIIEALYGERDEFVSSYYLVKKEKEIIEAYKAGLEEYIEAIEDQMKIALIHSDSFLNYADQELFYSSLASTFKSESLRNSVLGFVEKKKGKDFSLKLRERLEKIDTAIDIFK